MSHPNRAVVDVARQGLTHVDVAKAVQRKTELYVELAGGFWRKGHYCSEVPGMVLAC